MRWGIPQIKGEDPADSARDAQAQGEGGHVAGERCDHESDALCGGAGVQLRDDAGPRGAGERAAICLPRRFAKRRAGRAFRSSKTLRWRGVCTRWSSRGSRFRLNSMRRWQEFWPICTGRRWKSECASERQAQQAAADGELSRAMAAGHARRWRWDVSEMRMTDGWSPGEDADACCCRWRRSAWCS